MRFLNYISTVKTSVLALALLLSFGFFDKLNSQPVVSMAQKLCCDSTTEMMSVEVSDFEDVGSFTFFIVIDTLLVDYVTIENTNALLGSTLIANFQEDQSQIAISWFSLVGITIEEGNLFDLKLNYYHGNAPLIFNNCEVANADGSIVENVVYENGSLLSALEILEQPQPQSVVQGEQVQFDLVLQNSGTQEFLWQEFDGLSWSDLNEGDTYSGVTTSSLSINNVPLDFNNFQYRCRINYSECSVFSDEALLNVLPLTVLNDFETDKKIINVFPNPFTSYFKYEINNTDAVNSQFRLFNLSGETVFDNFVAESYGKMNTKNLEPGMYFLQVSHNESSEFIKLIKR